MTKIIRPIFAVVVALGLSACAPPPPPEMAEAPPAPQKRCVDVKMDLDTHRNCR